MTKKILSTALFFQILFFHSILHALTPPLSPSILPVNPAGPSLSLRTSPLEEKGIQLDQMALEFLSQKLNKQERALQAQENMIVSLARSLVSSPTAPVVPGSLIPFGQIFKKIGISAASKVKLPAPSQTLEIKTPAPISVEILNQKINEAISLLPTDAQIQAGSTLSPAHIALAGKIVNALAVQSVQPIGFRLHHASCDNIILKYTNSANQPVSAISEYFAAIPYKDSVDYSRKSVEALAKVHQGIRCLNNKDFSSVDASITAGLLDLYYRLMKDGKIQVARATIDSSLPLAILLFDAAKYFEIPQTSRVFCLPKELNMTEIEVAPTALSWRMEPNERYGALKIGNFTLSPTLGAGLASSCDLSLMRLLLEDPSNVSHSTLQMFGIWAENPFDIGHPINKVNLGNALAPTLSPFEFIQHMIDFRNWGEGDCSLHEWAAGGGSCRSTLTCEIMSELNSLPQIGNMIGSGFSIGGRGGANVPQIGGGRGSFGSSGGRGSSSSRSSTPANGAPNSANTLFGIERSSVSNHCGGSRGGSGGAGGAPACGMPTGSQRLFSEDPEMNRLMQCAVRSTQGSFQVSTDLFSNPMCKLKISLDDKDDNQNRSHQNDSQTARTEEETREANRREAAERIRGELSSLSSRLTAELERRGYTVRGGDATTLAALTNRLALVENAEFGDIADSEDAVGLFDETRGGGTIVFDSEHALGDLYVTAVHELLHATLEYMGWQGYTEMSSDGVMTRGDTMPALDHRTSSEREEHRIIGSLGYRQCDPDSPSCNNSCSYSDMRLTRFADCISQTPNRGSTLGQGICSVTPDLCGDGRGRDVSSGAGIGNECFGNVNIPQQCLLVSCDPSAGVSIPGCCQSGGGSTAPGAGGVQGPGTPGFWNSICNLNPDRCGDGRGGRDDLPTVPGGGTFPPPGGPEGSSPLP